MLNKHIISRFLKFFKEALLLIFLTTHQITMNIHDRMWYQRKQDTPKIEALADFRAVYTVHVRAQFQRSLKPD